MDKSPQVDSEPDGGEKSAQASERQDLHEEGMSYNAVMKMVQYHCCKVRICSIFLKLGLQVYNKLKALGRWCKILKRYNFHLKCLRMCYLRT